MDSAFPTTTTQRNRTGNVQPKNLPTFGGFTQSPFRSFPTQASGAKLGMMSRGIPSEAIEAQLAHERANTKSLERPKYRSFAMPPAAAPAASPFGGGLGSLRQPALLGAQFSRSSSVPASSPFNSRTFDPYKSEPVYRGMSLPPSSAPLMGHRGTSLDSPLAMSLGMASTDIRKSKGVSPMAIVGHAPLSQQPGDEVIIPPLPGAPYQLERHSSFYTCAASADALKKVLDAALDKAGADYEFKSHKCKWKVFAFDGNQSAKVVVKVFQLPSDKASKFAIEFQRRKGDAFVFFRWYRTMYNELVSAGFVSGEDGVAVQETLKASFDVRQTEELQAVPTLQPEDLLPLVNMAKAPFDDVQAEAVREIAKLLTNKENQKQFVSLDFIPTLRDLLKSPNYDVNRCAATSIACIAQTCTAQLVKEGVEKALCDFLRDLSRKLPERQSQRESVRALCQMLECPRTESQIATPSVQQARSVLNELKDKYCNDKRLQQMCGKALRVA